ncbi:hypothetical protein VTI74DRAFT_5939 [Chaetomium olivicolor]
MASFFRRLSLQKGRKAPSTSNVNETGDPPREDEQPEPLPITIPVTIPETQTVLLLLAAKQPYQLTENYAVPQLEGECEVLVRTQAIGLNPIDWKAPDFNFAIPTLPYISGRELAGEVVLVQKPSQTAMRLKTRDRVLVISTDYRDLRKAAYQEQECLDGILSHERATAGDWLAIWGGSSTSANLIIQLANLAGLKTIAVVDKAKHGLRLANHKIIRTALLVDSHDPKRAVDIIRGNLNGNLRFGIDTRGRDSATSLLQALVPGNLAPSSSVPVAATTDSSPPPSPPATPHNSTLLSAHLIGLTGLPKQSPPEGALFHTVPIKLFHEVPAIGRALVQWLERLLEKGLVSPPEIIDIEQGLDSVNKGLDRMRKGEISGGKLVVRIA